MKTSVDKYLNYLNQDLLRLAMIALLYVSGFIFLCQLNSSFGFYAGRVFPLLWQLRNTGILILSFMSTVALGALLIWNYWRKVDSSEQKYVNFFSRMDFLFLTLAASYCVISQMILVRAESRYWRGNRLLTTTIISYIAILLWLEIGIRHFKKQDFSNVFYLPKFYQKYPFISKVGSLVTMLLLSLLALLLLVSNEWQFFRGGLILFIMAGVLEGVRFAIQFSDIETMIKGMSAGKKVNAKGYSMEELLPIGMELERLSVSYEEALEESIRAERFKAELITNVSHDIRTPLTSIISYIDLLGNLEIENQDFNDYTSILKRKALRLKTLIDDLLEASKVGSGNIELFVENLNINELVGQVYGEFEERLQTADLEVILKHPKEELKVRADGRYLFRVIENIFGNCTKYSLPGTRIYSEISKEDNQVILALKNISKEPLDIDKEDLTKQFIRGDRSRKTEGNGLGLYIGKSLTEIMGGSFDIDLVGDTFVVTLKLPMVM